jgi:hypothetical protein
MSENNPDILIPSLKELIDHLNKWNYYASESIKESEELLSVATDCTEDSKVIVKLSENQVMDDSTKVENEKNDIRTLKSKCELEKSVITQLLNLSKSSLELAYATLNYWENELLKATKWVQKARKRLEDANNNYADAIVNLENARIELESAKEQLDDCLNDGKRLCLPELAVVAAARINHVNALIKRKKAKIELRDSEKDLEKAILCKINCENAHKVSVQLVPSAQSTYNSAIEANDLIDRSFTDVTEADDISKKAEGTNDIQKEYLNETRVLLNNQIALNNEAEIIQIDNLNLTNSSQDLVLGSTRDLESRIESLIKFAQPTAIQKSASSDVTIKSFFKNPVTIAGSILAASTIFGADASSLTAGALMSLLAVGGNNKNGNKLPDISESGIFSKTGPKIQKFSTKHLGKKLKKIEKNVLDHPESITHKSLDEKLIKELPIFTGNEQKYILDKQRLNNQFLSCINTKKLNTNEIGSILLTKQNNPYFNKSINIDHNTSPIETYTYRSPYFSLNEKVKNTAKNILINQGPFEKYYDPIGKAIDDAANKEFPGHCVLSPNDKFEIKKAMQYEQYQHPTYLMQSMQASLYNNNYNSIKPLY